MGRLDKLLRAYRATGADLPFGNPLADHGVAMEGWFWRVTDPASGRVLIGLIGLNRPSEGEPWSMVGLASDPAGTLQVRSFAGAQALPTGARTIRPARPPQPAPDHDGASPRSATLTPAGPDDHFEADHHGLRARLGEDEVGLRFSNPRRWPHRAFGGSSIFQSAPGLNQYWHPWLLGGRASGTIRVGGQTWQVDQAQLYAEKNWGRAGFPESWWWGQAQGFGDQQQTEVEPCVAFAGGEIYLGRPDFTRPGGRRRSIDVTALVVALPDGRVLRLGNPGTSPVHTTTSPGHWQLRGRTLTGWRVEVDAQVPPSRAFVLPVPLVDERAEQPGAVESLTGDLAVRVWHRGRQVWHGTTSFAGLEAGGLAHATAELASRNGDPRPLPT